MKKSDGDILIGIWKNDIIEEYNEKFQLWQKATNKQKKKLKREMRQQALKNQML